MSRRILRDRMRREASYTPRLFSAQIYDIPSREYCRVIVQGSTSLVFAWFSRNFRHRPDEMKVGTAVICQYKLGNRGQIEVVGHGTVIPTPIAGQPTPATPTGADTIFSGLQVLAIPAI